MWSQIESEMCLQRSKTIAQMCKTKQVTTKSNILYGILLSSIFMLPEQEVKCRMREESSRPLAASAPQSFDDQETEVGVDLHFTAQSHQSSSQTSSRGKQAMILKNPADDLGMAIIGGREHNLPIIISEIFPGTAVARSNRVRAKHSIKLFSQWIYLKLSFSDQCG